MSIPEVKIGARVIGSIKLRVFSALRILLALSTTLTLRIPVTHTSICVKRSQGVISLKVTENTHNLSNLAGLPGKDERKATGSTGTNFHGQLKRVESRNYEERINGLVDRIVEQGEKLGRRVDIKELKIYKDLVSEFLDEAVGNCYKFSKHSFLDRRGRHRTYAIIKKINSELELLTNDVLKEEKDNIGILQRLDDIRGLILDIIL